MKSTDPKKVIQDVVNRNSGTLSFDEVLEYEIASSLIVQNVSNSFIQTIVAIILVKRARKKYRRYKRYRNNITEYDKSFFN